MPGPDLIPDTQSLEGEEATPQLGEQTGLPRTNAEVPSGEGGGATLQV